MTGLAFPIYKRWIDDTEEITKDDAIRNLHWAREPWVDGRAHLWKRGTGLNPYWRSICGAASAFDIVSPTKYTEKCKRCLRIVKATTKAPTD